jgi:hypothetical protein
MAAAGQVTGSRRRGRPPLSSEPSTTLTARLPISEFETVCSVASKGGLSVSAWVRRAVLIALSVNNRGY